MSDTPTDCAPVAKHEPIKQGPIVRAEDAVKKAQEWAGADKDGQWGKDTSKKFQEKIETYQKEHGIAVTGKYDEKTADAMRNDPTAKDAAAGLDAMKKSGVLDRVYAPKKHEEPGEQSCKAPTTQGKNAIIHMNQSHAGDPSSPANGHRTPPEATSPALGGLTNILNNGDHSTGKPSQPTQQAPFGTIVNPALKEAPAPHTPVLVLPQGSLSSPSFNDGFTNGTQGQHATPKAGPALESGITNTPQGQAVHPKEAGQQTVPKTYTMELLLDAKGGIAGMKGLNEALDAAHVICSAGKQNNIRVHEGDAKTGKDSEMNACRFAATDVRDKGASR